MTQGCGQVFTDDADGSDDTEDSAEVEDTECTKGISVQKKLYACHLYVFQSGAYPKLFKVGRSNDVDRRRREISKLYKCNIKHCATYSSWGKLERNVHNRLCMQRSAAKKHHGSCKEWFYTPLEQILNIIEEEILQYKT